MLLGAAALVFINAETFERKWVRPVLLAALLASHFIIGLSAIREFANPNFDVYWCQTQSLDALLKGVNPHTLTLDYRPGDEVNYPASYVFGGRVHIGFPYPPLSLLLALPGYLLGGDYRYSNLAAITLSAFFIASARPSRVSFLAAALFLSAPCVLPVLKSGWTEPYVVLMLSATVFCACRAPRLLPWALGLLFASKQYAVFAGLAVFLLPVEPDTLKGYAALIGKALLLATAITLPLALWNVGGFINDVVKLQFLLPFRMDSLSYLVWLTYNTGVQPPAALGFLMMLPAVALAAWRGARTPAGFAAAPVGEVTMPITIAEAVARLLDQPSRAARDRVYPRDLGSARRRSSSSRPHRRPGSSRPTAPPRWRARWPADRSRRGTPVRDAGR